MCTTDSYETADFLAEASLQVYTGLQKVAVHVNVFSNYDGSLLHEMSFEWPFEAFLRGQQLTLDVEST